MNAEAMVAAASRDVRRGDAGARPHVTRTGRADLRASLAEAWQYRDVLLILVWRDIKVRYKQTAIGVAWAIVQPTMMMAVFSIFLGALAGTPSDGVPYPIFVFSALLPWQLFAHALVESGNSLVANRELLTKVYFPRLFLPIAPVLGGLVDSALALVVLVAMMLWYGIVPGPALALLLPLSVFAVATALAVGIWLAAVNLRYRDVRYLLPFLAQIWFFTTPVAYPASLIPPPWQPWYGLNPMVGVIEGFRWALLGISITSTTSILVSVLSVAILLVGGVYYFHRNERRFADYV